MDAGKYNFSTTTIDDYIGQRYKNDKSGKAAKAKKLISTDSLGFAKLGGVNIGEAVYPEGGSTQYKVSDLDKAFGAFDAQQAQFENAKKTTPTAAKVTPSGVKPYTVGNVNDNIINKANSAWDYIYGKNPYETEAGKSIMKSYDIKGQFAKDGAIASGASANSGNIDSYAASNALRQQAAFNALGNQAVLDYHNSTINNLKDVLGILGSQSDRMYNQNRQENIDIAQLTGYVPNEMALKVNPYFNSDGTLANPETDYEAIRVELEKKLAQTTDPTEREKIQKDLNDVLAARFYKVTNVPGFEQYREGAVAPSALKTNERYLAQQQTQTEADIADKEIKSKETMHSNELAHEAQQNAEDREYNKWLAQFDAESKSLLNALTHEQTKELMGMEHDNAKEILDLTSKYEQQGYNIQGAYDLAIAKYKADASAAESYANNLAKADEKNQKELLEWAKRVAENGEYYTESEKLQAKEILGDSDYAYYMGEAQKGRNGDDTVSPEETSSFKNTVISNIAPDLKVDSQTEQDVIDKYFVTDTNGGYRIRNNITDDERKTLLYGGRVYSSDTFYDENGNIVPKGKATTGKVSRSKNFVGIIPYIDQTYPNISDKEYAELLTSIGVTKEEIAKYEKE